MPRLRTIAAKSEMSLARIDRSKLFYLNFDRSPLDQDEIDRLLAIECRLNRLSGILERIGAGLVPAASSPSLEGCALFDAWHIAKTTNDVPRLLDTASSDNPWGKPGTVACQPGGESGDVRTRCARIVEALNVVTRLDSIPIGQTLPRGLCSFGLGTLLWMPCRNVNTTLKMTLGARLDEDTRAIGPRSTMRACNSRFAAACFAAGTCITRCYVQIAAPTVSRASALSRQRISLGARPIWPIACLSLRILKAWTLDDMPCKRVLEAYGVNRSGDDWSRRRFMLVRVMTIARCRRRCAIAACRYGSTRLEVMEEDDDPYVARVVEFARAGKVDRTGAFERLLPSCRGVGG